MKNSLDYSDSGSEKDGSFSVFDHYSVDDNSFNDYSFNDCYGDDDSIDQSSSKLSFLTASVKVSSTLRFCLKDNEDDSAVLVAALLPTTLSVPSLDVSISSDDESSISSDESLMSETELLKSFAIDSRCDNVLQSIPQSIACDDQCEVPLTRRNLFLTSFSRMATHVSTEDVFDKWGENPSEIDLSDAGSCCDVSDEYSRIYDKYRCTPNYVWNTHGSWIDGVWEWDYCVDLPVDLPGSFEGVDCSQLPEEMIVQQELTSLTRIINETLASVQAQMVKKTVLSSSEEEMGEEEENGGVEEKEEEEEIKGEEEMKEEEEMGRELEMVKVVRENQREMALWMRIYLNDLQLNKGKHLVDKVQPIFKKAKRRITTY